VEKVVLAMLLIRNMILVIQAPAPNKTTMMAKPQSIHFKTKKLSFWTKKKSKYYQQEIFQKLSKAEL